MSETLVDIFNGDAFGIAELTASVNKVEQTPNLFGQVLNVNEQGITTTIASVEEKQGRLYVIQSSERGSEAKPAANSKRKLRHFTVPHFKESASIHASEVQGNFAFGSRSLAETVTGKRDEKNADMRARHEITREKGLAGMAQGILYDADGSVLQDWHAADGFNTARTEYAFDITDASLDLRVEALKIKRKVMAKMGGFMVKKIDWFLPAEMFDPIISHPSIREMYKRFQESALLRNDPSMGSLILADNVHLWCYDPNELNGDTFIPTDKSFAIPNADGFLQGRFSPADTLETANTIGLPFYGIPGETTARKVSWETESNFIYFAVDPSAIANVTFE